MPSGQPEIKLARRLVARKNLVPPVDIMALAANYADVRELLIPFDIDGVCLDLKSPGKHPRIFINLANRTDQRRRFTLAHELGHVLIPTHTGLIVDTGSAEGTDWSYRFMEAEANRFASELLIPSVWLQPHLVDPDPIALTQYIHQEANVSWTAATLRLSGALPRSYGYAQINRHGVVVERGGWRPASGAKIEIGNQLVEPREWVDRRWETSLAGAKYIWWKSIDELPISDAGQDEDWRPKLESALSRCGLSDSERRSYWASINGVISAGSVRGQGSTSPQSIKFRCMRSFVARAESDHTFSILIKDPDFLSAIDLRSIELSARRTLAP